MPDGATSPYEIGRNDGFTVPGCKGVRSPEGEGNRQCGQHHAWGDLLLVEQACEIVGSRGVGEEHEKLRAGHRKRVASLFSE